MDNNNEEKRTKCEVYTRVMGYLRPVSQFNIGKKSEHYSRIHFTEAKTANSIFCQTYGLTLKEKVKMEDEIIEKLIGSGL